MHEQKYAVYQSWSKVTHLWQKRFTYLMKSNPHVYIEVSLFVIYFLNFTATFIIKTLHHSASNI